MTPFDFAKQAVSIDVDGHNFVVSIGDDTWRHILTVGPSAERADYFALQMRQTIARVAVIPAQVESYHRIAAEMNGPQFGCIMSDLNKEQFAAWLRWQAQLITSGIPLP